MESQVLNHPSNGASPNGQHSPRLDTIRVLLVDGHRIFRAGTRLLLEADPGILVVGEALNLEDAIDLVQQTHPHIILLNVVEGGSAGVSILPQLRSIAPRSQVVLLAGPSGQDDAIQAITYGAVGLVRTDQAPETLFTAMRRVHAGEVWIERALVARMLKGLYQKPSDRDREAARIEGLTEREREVIGGLSRGLTNRELAELLSLSEATIHSHLSTIYTKLGMNNRLALVIYAYRNGLASTVS